MISVVNINDIQKSIAQDLENFREVYKAAYLSDYSMLKAINSYVLKQQGKHLRVVTLLLVAKMLGDVNTRSYEYAAILELLHHASLIHDDVVDEAELRRGIRCVHKVWSAKEAVLTGDFLLSQAILMTAHCKDFGMIEMVASVGRNLSEGELLQTGQSKSLDMTEEVYFDIIRRKTAFLIGASTQAGAMSVGANEEDTLKMRDFGLALGMAFQIKDDILDYIGGDETGKAKGNDLKELKLTLPVLHYLSTLNQSKQDAFLKKLEDAHEETEFVERMIKSVIASGGIVYAEKVMKKYMEEALVILKDFPESEARKSLEDLIVFVADRRH